MTFLPPSKLIRLLAIAAFSLSVAGAAHADSVWDYQGNTVSYPLGIVGSQPITEPYALTGSVTLDDAGAPVAWDFTAGTLTLTNLNSTSHIVDLGTLFRGPAFSEWSVQLFGADGAYIETMFNGSLNDAQDEASNGFYVRSDPGSWQDPVSTPEPSAALLLLVGLAAFALWRKL